MSQSDGRGRPAGDAGWTARMCEALENLKQYTQVSRGTLADELGFSAATWCYWRKGTHHTSEGRCRGVLVQILRMHSIARNAHWHATRNTIPRGARRTAAFQEMLDGAGWRADGTVPPTDPS